MGEWQGFFERLKGNFGFFAPAPLEEIEELEGVLNVKLPDALKRLLLETNGIYDRDAHLQLIWPCVRLIEANTSFRSHAGFRQLYMPFEPLLFFSHAGNGDQFAFRILDREIRYEDVYVWDHEDDSRTWVAPSLERFILGIQEGTITT